MATASNWYKSVGVSAFTAASRTRILAIGPTYRASSCSARWMTAGSKPAGRWNESGSDKALTGHSGIGTAVFERDFWSFMADRSRTSTLASVLGKLSSSGWAGTVAAGKDGRPGTDRG